MDSPYIKKTPRASTRNTENLSVGQAIDKLISLYKLEGKLNEVAIQDVWEDLLGKPIALRTTEIYIKKNILFLKIESAPLKNELWLAKDKLLERLNQKLGNTLLKEIKFI
ncbi:MAG: hypothetical protein RIR51_720 [Bacteroidota bacterium]|jgi:hypothetical protein